MFHRPPHGKFATIKVRQILCLKLQVFDRLHQKLSDFIILIRLYPDLTGIAEPAVSVLSKIPHAKEAEEEEVNYTLTITNRQAPPQCVFEAWNFHSLFTIG